MNLNICEQAEERPTPIRTAPSWCVIQSFIIRRGQTFRETFNQIFPHRFRSELTDAQTCPWFDIGRESFFDPMMRLRNAWKGEMHHLVYHHPIALEEFFICQFA